MYIFTYSDDLSPEVNATRALSFARSCEGTELNLESLDMPIYRPARYAYMTIPQRVWVAKALPMLQDIPDWTHLYEETDFSRILTAEILRMRNWGALLEPDRLT